VRLADESVSFLPAGALESFRDDLHLTYAQGGIVLAIYAGVPSAAIGVAADRMSRRLLAALGAAGYGVGLLLFAMGQSFIAACIAVVVMGVSSDALVRGCEVALADIAGDDLRAALAAQNVLASIGDMIGPLLLAGALGSGLGWRAAFVVASLLMFGYAAVLAVQPMPGPVELDDGDAPLPSMRQMVRDPRVLLLSAGALLIGLFDEPLAGFAIADLGGGAVATLVVGASTIGGLAGALLATRVRIRPVVASSALGVALGAFIVVPWLSVRVVAIAVVGAAAYIVWIDVQAALLTAHPGRAGTASAVADLLSTPGVLFPIAVGAVADANGLGWALGLYLAAAAVLVATSRSW
jgi:FSR family fosmidomycin resistance protein-like MFS transporter